MRRRLPARIPKRDSRAVRILRRILPYEVKVGTVPRPTQVQAILVHLNELAQLYLNDSKLDDKPFDPHRDYCRCMESVARTKVHADTDITVVTYFDPRSAIDAANYICILRKLGAV